MNNVMLMAFTLNLLKGTFHLPHFPDKSGLFKMVWGKFSAPESSSWERQQEGCWGCVLVWKSEFCSDLCLG